MDYWRAFGRKFFVNHQAKLLWLLNTPVIGRWFRSCMGIRGGERFIGILPHATFREKDGKIVADFRTHWKYSKRLYYAFRYLWWACHYWDEFFADRLVPQLSFGLASLTSYPDATPTSTTTDGRTVQSYNGDYGVSWAALTGLSASNVADKPSVPDAIVYVQADTVINPNEWVVLCRSFFLFDTSALTSSAVISGATISFYHTTAFYESGTTTSGYNVYSASPTSNTVIAVGDFSKVGSTAFCDTAVTSANHSQDAYNDLTFNSQGIASVSKTGISKYSARLVNDVSGTPPSWAGSAYDGVDVGFADVAGTDYDPKLVVTYSLPPSTWVSNARLIFIARSDGSA